MKLESVPSFNSYIKNSIVKNWDKEALTDYQGITLQYHDVARKISKLHILFENSDIQKGDKIALCGRNSSNWAIAFLATITYGAVAVLIQHEFTSAQIHNIVNHSEAKLLFIGDVVATQINNEEMPGLEGIINIPDYSLHLSRSKSLFFAREHLNEYFGKKFPKYFRKEHIHFYTDNSEDLAIINYTSGTTGFSKGVMIPYRALWSNLDFAIKGLGKHINKGSNVLNILPMAHMYGLMVEFILQLCLGSHQYFLNRAPSPSLIAKAFIDVKPAIVIAVPLIIEKIVRKKIFPIIQKNPTKLLMGMPVVNKKIKESICKQVKEAFGGNLYEIIVGGAALNKEVETFLVDIGFPITTGYGTTETAPLISFSDWKTFIPGSCGQPVTNIKVKILSENPEVIPGEILVKGMNVMLGYYKNPEETNLVIDKEGWYHTGDLGTMKNGYLYINGRIKNLLLGANGQNVYPEEIEDQLNSMTLVSESLIIQKGNKFIGLVYPDFDEAKTMGLDITDLEKIMDENKHELNNQLPNYCKLSDIIIHEKEFEKTPKKSIKRYKYQDFLFEKK